VSKSGGLGDPQDAVGLGACNGGANQHWRMVVSKDYYQIIGINNRSLELRHAARRWISRIAMPGGRGGCGRWSKRRTKNLLPIPWCSFGL